LEKKRQPMKIAIVRLSAMGDIIQSMIVLQIIKKYSPKSTIDWYVEDRFYGLLKDANGLNNVFYLKIKGVRFLSIPFKIIELYKSLRSNGSYDLVIDLQGLIKSGLISRMIRAKKRCGFDSNSARESLSAFFYTKSFRVPYDENVVKRNIMLVERCLDIKIPPERIKFKKSIFKKNTSFNKSNYAVFVIGASFDSKIYPIEKFAEIANSIELDIKVIWHSESEKMMADELKKLSPKVIITKKLNFDDLKDLIFNARIVIGGDTGPTHLAWAGNIPSITIFGSTPMERNFLQTEINFGIKSDTYINPYKINKDDFSIRNIDSSEISALAKKLLKI